MSKEHKEGPSDGPGREICKSTSALLELNSILKAGDIDGLSALLSVDPELPLRRIGVSTL